MTDFDRGTPPFMLLTLRGNNTDESVDFKISSDVYSYANASFRRKIHAHTDPDGFDRIEDNPGHFTWEWTSNPGITPGEFIWFYESYEIDTKEGKRTKYNRHTVRVQKQLNEEGTRYELKKMWLRGATQWKVLPDNHKEIFVNSLPDPDETKSIYKFGTSDTVFYIPMNSPSNSPDVHGMSIAEGINFLHTPPFPVKIVDGKEIYVRPNIPVFAEPLKTDKEYTDRAKDGGVIIYMNPHNNKYGFHSKEPMRLISGQASNWAQLRDQSSGYDPGSSILSGNRVTHEKASGFFVAKMDDNLHKAEFSISDTMMFNIVQCDSPVTLKFHDSGALKATLLKSEYMVDVGSVLMTDRNEALYVKKILKSGNTRLLRLEIYMGMGDANTKKRLRLSDGFDGKGTQQLMQIRDGMGLPSQWHLKDIVTVVCRKPHAKHIAKQVTRIIMDLYKRGRSHVYASQNGENVNIYPSYSKGVMHRVPSFRTKSRVNLYWIWETSSNTNENMAVRSKVIEELHGDNPEWACFVFPPGRITEVVAHLHRTSEDDVELKVVHNSKDLNTVRVFEDNRNKWSLRDTISVIANYSGEASTYYPGRRFK